LLSQLRVAFVRSEKLVSGWGQFRISEEREHILLEAATKQSLEKTEDFTCAVVTSVSVQ
jgi:hypothetical protein